MANLRIGEILGGNWMSKVSTFTLPDDAIARTFAIIGQRGAGKSSTATVMAEELCKASLPWMALDPVGVWWGLRAKADGSPGGFPVVVFGGQRGDLPLEKGHGRKIAEACIAANVFAVIDLSQESKTVWRTIVRDFCHALQALRPETPRHVFLEEAPEFVPQKPSHQLGHECKEIVERLVRLGRNWGYGATVLSQRPATVDKDVLSQCENLFMMRTSGAQDRKALTEWTKAHQAEGLDGAMAELASMPDGTAWFWSPQWLKQFVKVAVRRRETFHPGETRTVGAKARAVELVDVDSFVAKVRKELTRTTAVVPSTSGPSVPTPRRDTLKVKEGFFDSAGRLTISQVPVEEFDKMKAERDSALAQVQELAEKLHQATLKKLNAERRLEAVRKHLEPQYTSLKALFEDLGKDAAPAGGEITPEWEQWLEKAAKIGARKPLEILVRRGRLKQVQLATLAGLNMSGGHWRKCRAFMTKNALAILEGDEIEAAKL